MGSEMCIRDSYNSILSDADDELICDMSVGSQRNVVVVETHIRMPRTYSLSEKALFDE